MRQLFLAAATIGLLTAGPVAPAPRKDPNTGKFIKCPAKAPVKVPRCKAANGNFAEFGTPGAKPI